MVIVSHCYAVVWVAMPGSYLLKFTGDRLSQAVFLLAFSFFGGFLIVHVAASTIMSFLGFLYFEAFS